VPHETLAAWAAGESVAEVDGQALDEALDAIELALGVGRVSRDGGSVAMVLGDGAEWDVLRLLDAAAGAVADDCSPEALDTMLADFSAPLFPEWPGAAWAGELDAACAAALGALRGRLADCLLRRGRHQEALGHYLALCEAEPDQESWHRGVMRCHSAAGHIALALRQYHACRSAVRQQRGQDPDPETRDLYMELLAGR
jgi:hypothetical protein